MSRSSKVTDSKKISRRTNSRKKYTTPEALRRWVERVIALRKRQAQEEQLKQRIRRIVQVKQTDAFTS